MSPQAREHSFDELARGLASGEVSRGKVLRLMGAALVGGTLASLSIGEAAAAPGGCKRDGKKCKESSQCCSLNCVDGICQGGCRGTLVTPVGGGDPFCACTVFCVASCADCAAGSTCVTAGTCVDTARPVACALPC